MNKINQVKKNEKNRVLKRTKVGWIVNKQNGKQKTKTKNREQVTENKKQNRIELYVICSYPFPSPICHTSNTPTLQLTPMQQTLIKCLRKSTLKKQNEKNCQLNLCFKSNNDK